MNVFNRAMTILLFVTLMIVVPIVMIFPDTTISFLHAFLSAVSSGLNVFNRVILIVVGIICFIICG